MKKDEARPFSAVTLIIGRKDITRGSVLDQVEEEEGPARNWLTTQFHLEKRLINVSSTGNSLTVSVLFATPTHSRRN